MISRQTEGPSPVQSSGTPSVNAQVLAGQASGGIAPPRAKDVAPRELFQGFITTLRHSDVFNTKNAHGQPETFRERIIKNCKLEKPLREFLEQERRAGSPHRNAIDIILARARDFDKRSPEIPPKHPLQYIWETSNAKLKQAKHVTVVLELLKEPAQQREPVIEALKAWAKPPSLFETFVGFFNPSPRLQVCRFVATVLADLNMK